MATWCAVGRGALDVSDGSLGESFRAVVLPVTPGPPQALFGHGFTLWSRLLSEGPLNEVELSEEEQDMLHDMRALGIASSDLDDTCRLQRINRAWMTSPTHELVYALITHVADDAGIPVTFIKGPVQRRQGLRTREHSGDVDVWVEPGREDELAAALEPWGWQAQPRGSVEKIHHSVTLKPDAWGCEIDLHYRFPGIGIDDATAFTVLRDNLESIEFASQTATVPATAAHSIIFGLHALRPLPSRGAVDLAPPHVVAALSKGGINAIRIAEQWRATPVLGNALAAAFPGETIHGRDEPIPADWAHRLADSNAQRHLAAIRQLPWWQRPRALWGEVWPSSAVIRMRSARAGHPQEGVMRGRLRHWTQALTEVMRLIGPKAARTSTRARERQAS